MDERIRTIRRVGGSHTVAIPPDLVRAFDLNPGDHVRWEEMQDGIIVKFFKFTENIAPAERVLEPTHAQQGSNNEF